jgi:hypothetical protein
MRGLLLTSVIAMLLGMGRLLRGRHAQTTLWEIGLNLSTKRVWSFATGRVAGSSATAEVWSFATEVWTLATCGQNAACRRATI